MRIIPASVMSYCNYCTKWSRDKQHHKYIIITFSFPTQRDICNAYDVK
ncbi:unnamed protein product, partial [Amoebophrya sp. A120]|eukprot:GSA120T00000154001.1